MLFCYRCAYKHLSMAFRVWDELHSGYAGDTAHTASLMADLAWASEHLQDRQPDIAAQIRSARLLIMEELITRPGEAPTTRPAFEEYLQLVLSLLQEDYRKHGK